MHPGWRASSGSALPNRTASWLRQEELLNLAVGRTVHEAAQALRFEADAQDGDLHPAALDDAFDVAALERAHGFETLSCSTGARVGEIRVVIGAELGAIDGAGLEHGHELARRVGG